MIRGYNCRRLGEAIWGIRVRQTSGAHVLGDLGDVITLDQDAHPLGEAVIHPVEDVDDGDQGLRRWVIFCRPRDSRDQCDTGNAESEISQRPPRRHSQVLHKILPLLLNWSPRRRPQLTRLCSLLQVYFGGKAMSAFGTLPTFSTLWN